jgi:hypothetical protein
MPTYREKSPQIEAMHWDGNNTSEVVDWILKTGCRSARWHEETPEVTWREEISNGAPWRPRFEHLVIDRAVGGSYHAVVGDWITLDTEGQHHRCEPETFAAFYEEVPE